jgi:hypothetical protein
LKEGRNRYGPAGAERALLLEIARCPLVSVAADTASHPCGAVVRAQQSVSLDDRHVPEPWSGMISRAPILFVSSNPAINPNEDFPTRLSADEEIVEFFEGRFQRTDQASHYWKVVRGVAARLLGRTPVAGEDYALTEAVRCKSSGEEGVAAAIGVCASLYLRRTFAISGATVVVALGKKSRGVLAEYFGLTPDLGVAELPAWTGEQRVLLKLGHPSSGERKVPTSDEIEAVSRYLALSAPGRNDRAR